MYYIKKTFFFSFMKNLKVYLNLAELNLTVTTNKLVEKNCYLKIINIVFLPFWMSQFESSFNHILKIIANMLIFLIGGRCLLGNVKRSECISDSKLKILIKGHKPFGGSSVWAVGSYIWWKDENPDIGGAPQLKIASAIKSVNYTFINI